MIGKINELFIPLATNIRLIDIKSKNAIMNKGPMV
jgi:hypothetical protein